MALIKYIKQPIVSSNMQRYASAELEKIERAIASAVDEFEVLRGSLAPLSGTTALDATGLNIGQSAHIVKGSNTDKVSTTTLAADPDLQMTLTGGQTFEFAFAVYFRFPTVITPGFRWTVGRAGNVDLTGSIAAIVFSNGGPTSTQLANITGVVLTSGGTLGASPDDNFVVGRGFLPMPTTATFAFSWRPNVSNAAITRVMAGQSYLRVTRIS